MIDSYAFGSMTVDGRQYGKDLMILPDGAVLHPWWRESGHRLTMADIQAIVDVLPDLLVVGTGDPGLMKPVGGLRENLRDRGIESMIMPTAEAVAVFNTARERSERVAGCFHLTC